MKKTIILAAILSSTIIFAQKTATSDSVKVQEIQEVTMNKKVFQKKADRLVYDVAASPIVKGNTVFNILKQTPLITSTDDKSLKITGKNNAVVFIDGRRTNMDEESLAQFLHNTPAENIQKIEVITVPGSEFNVESSDGIINIILKKKNSNGLNGNMRMSNRQNYFNATNAAVSLNYRKDKLGINSNISTGQNIQMQTYTLRNRNEEGSNQTTGSIQDPNANLGGYLNVDYQLSDKSNLALSWNSWANRSYNSTANLYNIEQDFTQNATHYTFNKNKDDSRSYNNSVNLNYELKSDSLGSKLNLNAAYLNYKRFSRADNRTYLSDIFQNTGLLESQILQETPQIINSISFLGDYIWKMDHDFTLAFGGNYNKTKTDNDLKIQYNGVPDNNRFVYDENIYGLYLTLEKKFSDQFSGKIGSRYEITNSIGTSDNPDNPELKRIERNYNNLLPYMSFNYAISNNHNISYAFSSRMRRPGFWELNPVISYLTKANYIQNNPFVKASSNYTNELTYMFKNSYFLVLGHTFKKNVITQVPLQGKIDGVNQLRYIRTNFGDRQEMSAVLGMNKSFFKDYLTTNINVGLQHNRNNGSLSVDPISGDVFPEYINRKNSSSLMIQTNNTLRLDQKKTWFLGVNYFYVDRQQIDLGLLKNLMSLDFDVKKVWNDWTFALEFRDILNTNIVEITDTQQNGNFNYIHQNHHNRSVQFSVVYNFGNKKVQKIRNIETADKDINSRTR